MMKSSSPDTLLLVIITISISSGVFFTTAASPNLRTNPAVMPTFVGAPLYTAPDQAPTSGSPTMSPANVVFDSTGEFFYAAYAAGENGAVPGGVETCVSSTFGTGQKQTLSECTHGNKLIKYNAKTGSMVWSANTFYNVIWMGTNPSSSSISSPNGILAVATPYYLAMIDIKTNTVWSNTSVQGNDTATGVDFANGDFIDVSTAQPFWSGFHGADEPLPCLLVKYTEKSNSTTTISKLVHFETPSSPSSTSPSLPPPPEVIWYTADGYYQHWEIITSEGADKQQIYSVVVQQAAGSRQLAIIRLTTPGAGNPGWCTLPVSAFGSGTSPFFQISGVLNNTMVMLETTSTSVTLYQFTNLTGCFDGNTQTNVVTQLENSFTPSATTVKVFVSSGNDNSLASSPGLKDAIICGKSTQTGNSSQDMCQSIKFSTIIQKSQLSIPQGATRTRILSPSSSVANSDNNVTWVYILDEDSGDIYGYKQGQGNQFAWMSKSILKMDSPSQFIGSTVIGENLVLWSDRNNGFVKIGSDTLTPQVQNTMVSLNTMTGAYSAIGWTDSATTTSSNKLGLVAVPTAMNKMILGWYPGYFFSRFQVAPIPSATQPPSTVLFDSLVTGIGISADGETTYVTDQEHFYALNNTEGGSVIFSSTLPKPGQHYITPVKLYSDSRGYNTKDFVVAMNLRQFDSSGVAQEIDLMFFSRTNGKYARYVASDHKCPGDSNAAVYIYNITSNYDKNTFYYSNGHGKCITQIVVTQDAASGNVTAAPTNYATQSTVYGALFNLGDKLYYGDVNGLVHWHDITKFGSTSPSDSTTSKSLGTDKGGAVYALTAYFGEVYVAKSTTVADYGMKYLAQNWYSQPAGLNVTARESQPLVAWNGKLFVFSDIEQGSLNIWEYPVTSFSQSQKPSKALAASDEFSVSTWDQGMLFDWGLYVIPMSNGLLAVDFNSLTVSWKLLIAPTGGPLNCKGTKKVFGQNMGTFMFQCLTTVYQVSYNGTILATLFNFGGTQTIESYTTTGSAYTKAQKLIGTPTSGGAHEENISGRYVVAAGPTVTITTVAPSPYSASELPSPKSYEPSFGDFLRRNKIWIAGIVAGVLVLLIVIAVAVNSRRSRKPQDTQYVAMSTPVNHSGASGDSSL